MIKASFFVKTTLLASCTLALFTQCQRQPYVSRADSVTMEEIYARVEDNQYELDHNQTELNILSQRLHSQNADLTNISQKLDILFKERQSLSHGEESELLDRITNLEKTNRQLIADLNRMKTHANIVTQSVNELYEQLDETERLKFSIDDLYNLVQKMKKPSSFNKKFSYYTVRKGDSIKALAMRFQVPEKELVKFNNLETDILFVGQQIRVPAS